MDNRYVQDVYKRQVVKRIFAMTVEGMGPYQIANKLKEEKILIPVSYTHLISVTSTQSTFSITAQSVSSQDEEAAFLIGIPNADIQKVIIPQYGMPAKLKEVRIEFEQPYGAVRVSKISADNGAVLSGATFELMNGAGTVLATQTTGADGTAQFDNLLAGSYTAVSYTHLDAE